MLNIVTSFELQNRYHKGVGAKLEVAAAVEPDVTTLSGTIDI